MLSFSRDPKGYIQDLLRSQSRDLKVKGSPGALDGRQAYREGSERCPPGGWRASGADPAAASQVMTDVAGNPEEERRAEFYHQPWSQEAVSRYFYCKVGRARAPQPPSLREGTPRLGGALLAPRGSSEAGGGRAGGALSLTGGTVTLLLLSLLTDPAAQAGAGAVAGRAQHLGAP